MPRHPRLQLVLVLEAERLDAGLALRALLPPLLRTLVAADVDVRAGEERAHLVVDLLHEPDRLVVAGAEDIVLHAVEHARHARQPFLACELGVRRKERAGVPRHLDLGHHRDEPLLRVGEDLADVRRRVEVGAILLAVAAEVALRPAAAVHGRLGPHRPVFHEFGETRDVEPPALVLGEVPVEHVKLVVGHLVEQTLHRLLAEEVPPLVQHEPAPPERRRVLYRATRQNGRRWNGDPTG